MNMRKLLAQFAFVITTVLAAAGSLPGQVHSSSSYAYLLDEKGIMEHIGFLASAEIAGRAAGTPQAREVAEYIAGKMESYGLLPFNSVSFFQPFSLPAVGHTRMSSGEGGSFKGYNVVGYLPAESKDADYIIIGAHFDHIGSLGEAFYPGADDNASGVAALLELAQAFALRYEERGDLGHHIVFVAFDGNNYSLQGSRYFVSHMGIPSERVSCMLNIDQIGSVLAPPGNSKEYLLVLGADKLAGWQKGQMDFANDFFSLGLHIDYTYYGSREFYDIFYKLSDQQSFTPVGIPALLFTSGITAHTNKESDSEGNLSVNVLRKRVELIYRFLWLIL